MKPKKCLIIEFEPEEKKVFTKLTKKIKEDQQQWQSKIKEWEDVGMENDPIINDFKKYIDKDQQRLDILTNAKNGIFCDRQNWENFINIIQEEVYGLEQNDPPLEKLTNEAKNLRFREIRDNF